MRMGFWALALVVGGAQTWGLREWMGADGVAYLDMAEAAANGEWKQLVNGLWSPLYPAVLSVGRPWAASEAAMVKVVNFGIYVATLGAFEWFLREWLRRRRRQDGLPEKALTALGYAVFLDSAVTLRNLAIIT